MRAHAGAAAVRRAKPLTPPPPSSLHARARARLKLFRRDGTLVTADARGFVAGDTAGKAFPWA